MNSFARYSGDILFRNLIAACTVAYIALVIFI